MQSTEHLTHRGLVERPPLELGRADRQLDVADEVIEFAIADGAIGLFPQFLTDDTCDLVGVGEHLVEAAVGGDPFHCGLLADLVDTDQVVARLADECGDIRILSRLDTVPFEHRVAVVTLEFGNPARIGVEQGDIVVHHLDRVTIAGDDEHSVALLRTLGGECREDVVGLEIFFGDRRDTHGVKRLFEEGDLPDELGRGLVAGALVLRVFAGAE